MSAEHNTTVNFETNFPELRDAYIAVNQRKPALEKYIDAMKPKKMKHPREIPDRYERSLHFWRFAFEKVRERNRDRKREEFQKASVVAIVGNNDLEESFDSDQD